MHLGLIGGIGPAATEFYYRGLMAGGSDVDLTIANASISALLDNQRRGDAPAQASIFGGHIRQLKAAGAEVAAVTSVAGHFCHDELAAISDLPLVSILETVNAHFAQTGIARVGMIGSPVAMATRLFGAITATEITVPGADRIDAVGQAYSAMAQRGSATQAEAAICLSAGQDLIDRHGAEAVLLGGTDLFLVFGAQDPGYPVIDAATLHVARLDRFLRGQHSAP